MRQALAILIFATIWVALPAQQLYLEVLSGINKTVYDSDQFSTQDNYSPLGFRLAVGADHVQVGGEYRMNLSNPTLTTSEGLQLPMEFDETYYGGFLRAKISKYPAMRFGLVLRAGAGMHKSTSIAKIPTGDVSFEYDPILGFHGGAGFSIPVFKVVMLELGYTYNYMKRPEAEFALLKFPEHVASYHAFQAGMSFNFVFGKRADDYRHLKENWRWRDGWRG